jgi:2-iminobutanoate/2-iminopropanoate deaminase
MTFNGASDCVSRRSRKEETMRNTLLRLAACAAVLVLPAGVFARGAGQAEPAKAAAKKAGPERAAAPMKLVTTDEAPKAIGPYSQAVVEGGYLFASGQIPLDPKTGELVGGTIEQSAERVLDNLEAVLKAAGLSFTDVVKTTVYLTKAEDFAAMNGIYARRMGEHKPARSTVIVAALPRNAPMEIDLIARAKR